MKLNNYVRLGNIIKAYRIKHDLSLADFSRMSGLSCLLFYLFFVYAHKLLILWA